MLNPDLNPDRYLKNIFRIRNPDQKNWKKVTRKAIKKNTAVLAELYTKIKSCHAAGVLKLKKDLYLSSTTTQRRLSLIQAHFNM
jgi:hypothetical protein